MDAIQTAILRLWEQGLSITKISARLNISHSKITQVLVTCGALETDESRLYRDGLTVPQIAERLGKSEKSVIVRVPYTKGMYNAEYPTKNALCIRRCRKEKHGNNISTD